MLDDIVYQIGDGRYYDCMLAKYVEIPDPSKQIVLLTRGGKPSDEDYLKSTLIFYKYKVGDELKTLEEVKADKLNEINNKCTEALDAMTPTYPDKELLTFDQQKQEALAYLADSNANCPLVEALSKNRGMNMKTLCEKIIAKANTFSFVSGSIIGQRQHYEDQLNTCTTKEEVHQIEPIYSLEQTNHV